MYKRSVYSNNALSFLLSSVRFTEICRLHFDVHLDYWLILLFFFIQSKITFPQFSFHSANSFFFWNRTAFTFSDLICFHFTNLILNNIWFQNNTWCKLLESSLSQVLSSCVFNKLHNVTLLRFFGTTLVNGYSFKQDWVLLHCLDLSCTISSARALF